MAAAKDFARFYRPELDVVRFVAFLFVFLHHLLPRAPDSTTAALPDWFAQVLFQAAEASKFGLSLFFTLSAYLICELLIREREATGCLQTKKFYIRRILRIWPLYFACLAIVLVIAFLPGGHRDSVVWAAWSAILLGNWYIVFFSWPATSMDILWSISIEEQFYLFAPWAIRFFNKSVLCYFGILLIASANVWLFFLGRFDVLNRSIWTNSFVQFENFAAGLLMCLFLRRWPIRVSIWQRFVLVAGSFICWYSASHNFNIVTPGSWPLIRSYGLATSGSLLLLVAFLGIDRKMLPAWAIYLGRISYGLYVFHSLVIHTVDVPFRHHEPLFGSTMMLLKGSAALGLTILIASLSYRFFETPFLKMKKHHEVIASRPV
jgi:peptidoglycan/LPS O-acetylase OafA/YrhL